MSEPEFNPFPAESSQNPYRNITIEDGQGGESEFIIKEADILDMIKFIGITNKANKFIEDAVSNSEEIETERFADGNFIVRDVANGETLYEGNVIYLFTCGEAKVDEKKKYLFSWFWNIPRPEEQTAELKKLADVLREKGMIYDEFLYEDNHLLDYLCCVATLELGLDTIFFEKDENRPTVHVIGYKLKKSEYHREDVEDIDSESFGELEGDYTITDSNFVDEDL